MSGYADSDVTLAMERGEVEGVCGLSYTTLKASRPEWFRDHKINILLQTQPHLRRRAESAGEPVRHVSRDRSALVQDLANSSSRDAKQTRKLI